MKLLALDCSTDWLSVAVLDARACHQRAERAGQTHSERILPLVQAALAEAGWRLTEVDAIAFGAGPGSFTGVRIACGVAQGLAMGAQLPVLPIGTLEALAQEAWRQHRATHVHACLDARMREVYVAAYEGGDAAWTAVQEPKVVKPDEVVALPGRWLAAGDGLVAYPELAQRLAPADPALRPTARAIGELARPRVLRHEGVAARDALPAYVRHRIALTAAERAAGVRL